MKVKSSNRIVWLFTVLVLVSFLAVVLYKVKEQYKDYTNSVTVSGCESGEIPTLKCEQGYVLAKANMQYGRWDNSKCEHATVNDKTPQKYMNYSIPDSYLGKQQATWGDVTAPKLAGEDPYPGVYKHYTITGTCDMPATTSVERNGCDGQKIADIKCPENYLVDKASMKYGRWDKKKCAGINVNDGTPTKFQEYPIDTKYYQGTDTVSVKMTPIEVSNGKDPVPGTFKQYQLKAQCKLH